MKFNIEVTDTFGGEANYCWVRRYTVRAKSFRGAANMLSRLEGGNWRAAGNYGDMARYDMKSAAICAFIEGVE